jgi:hypothetical protein
MKMTAFWDIAPCSLVELFLLINLKEVSQEVDPNPDGGTVCKVI